jgi:deazaflavin-dependent oxidoreductase (nitroreductase family)
MTFPRALARYTRGAVNTMTLHFAGHAAFADLEHTGRKSGIVHHTPVRAFRTGETVVVGLNFGRQSDWYRNIKAAGTCRMRLGREQLTLGPPTLVPVEQGVKDIPWLFRFALRHVVRTAECVQLPILDATDLGHPAVVNQPGVSGGPLDSPDGSIDEIRPRTGRARRGHVRRAQIAPIGRSRRGHPRAALAAQIGGSVGVLPVFSCDSA